MTTEKEPSLNEHPVLKEFEDVFQYVLKLPPKWDIDFTINLVPKYIPTSKAP